MGFCARVALFCARLAHGEAGRFRRHGLTELEIGPHSRLTGRYQKWRADRVNGGSKRPKGREE